VTRLHFNLNKLKPGEKWPDKLTRLLDYFEKDSQLRDILVTGGDALMSSDKSLQKIFDGIYEMAVRKKKLNEKRPDNEKYAEIIRVMLGTRMPVYLPQRITPELSKILTEFKSKASEIGIKQFIIQTHFESPREITPEARQGDPETYFGRLDCNQSACSDNSKFKKGAYRKTTTGSE